MAAFVFLHANRYRLMTTNERFYHAVASVADGSWSTDELTRFIRRNTQPWQSNEA